MPANETNDTQTGKEQRFQQPCGCDTTPADQREDHDEKLRQMFMEMDSETVH